MPRAPSGRGLDRDGRRFSADGTDPITAARERRGRRREEEGRDGRRGGHPGTARHGPSPFPGNGAGRRAAASLGARAIAVFTRSGLTARILSKFRPPAPVVAFTPHERTAARMALYRGVSPSLLSAVQGSTGDAENVERAVAKIRADRIAPEGSRFVVVYGSTFGHCDQMRVVTV